MRLIFKSWKHWKENIGRGGQGRSLLFKENGESLKGRSVAAEKSLRGHGVAAKKGEIAQFALRID